jgi:hypothetical protein
MWYWPFTIFVLPRLRNNGVRHHSTICLHDVEGYSFTAVGLAKLYGSTWRGKARLLFWSGYLSKPLLWFCSRLTLKNFLIKIFTVQMWGANFCETSGTYHFTRYKNTEDNRFIESFLTTQFSSSSKHFFLVYVTSVSSVTSFTVNRVTALNQQ